MLGICVRACRVCFYIYFYSFFGFVLAEAHPYLRLVNCLLFLSLAGSAVRNGKDIL